jgi:hypothetical protein
MAMIDTSDDYYVGHCPLPEIHVRNIMFWETSPFLCSSERLFIECISVACNMILPATVHVVAPNEARGILESLSPCLQNDYKMKDYNTRIMVPYITAQICGV